MDNVLCLLVATGGMLLLLGLGGLIFNLICNIKPIHSKLNRFFDSLPMSRKEVNELSRRSRKRM